MPHAPVTEMAGKLTRALTPEPSAGTMMLAGHTSVQLCVLQTGLEPETTILSTRTPFEPAATALLSVPTRQRNLIG
jgi:hypothetical protein